MPICREDTYRAQYLLSPSPLSPAAHSVRFEKDGDGGMTEAPRPESRLDPEPPPEPEPEPSLINIHSERWSDVNDVHKRNLDYWCFAEHHEPHILLQVNTEFKSTAFKSTSY
jgi:hypothetical protein